jgi:hypothetical protein
MTPLMKTRSATTRRLASTRDVRIVYEHMKLFLFPNVPNFRLVVGARAHVLTQ